MFHTRNPAASHAGSIHAAPTSMCRCVLRRRAAHPGAHPARWRGRASGGAARARAERNRLSASCAAEPSTPGRRDQRSSIPPLAAARTGTHRQVVYFRRSALPAAHRFAPRSQACRRSSAPGGSRGQSSRLHKQSASLGRLGHEHRATRPGGESSGTAAPLWGGPGGRPRRKLSSFRLGGRTPSTPRPSVARSRSQGALHILRKHGSPLG